MTGGYQFAQQLQDLRLQRHVQRRRRLVGDQQFRLSDQRHGDQHALAHAPRELVRVVARPPRGVLDADLLKHADGQRVRRRTARGAAGARLQPQQMR